MADLLNVKEVENKKVKFSKSTYDKQVYHINRKDKKTINSSLFRKIYENFEKRYGANSLLIRAVNNEGIKTFKSFDADELNFDDFEEYYKNKVADTNNFEYFYSMEITILKKN